MFKTLAAIAASAAVIASSLVGYGTTPTAEAATTAVNFVSWPKDVIYVYDATAAIKKADGAPVWAVRAAAARWAVGNPVDFRYTTKPCLTGVQCVVVRQAELAAPAIGSASIGSAGTDITSVTVVLDTTFGRTNGSARRRNVVCHELGHSLGLKHRTGTTSCLTSYATSQQYPDATDIKNLNTMYGYR